ncbi:MAG: UDP-2,3-diacylglucosamine diphosphatase [Gemmataceae bacterium]
MRTLILSDLHLGSKHSCHSGIHDILDKEKFDRLILNGDTIHNVNLRKLDKHHWKVLNRLRDLGKSIELVLIRGNHDHETDFIPAEANGHLTTGNVLPSLLGVPMFEEYALPVRGKTYLVLHGDRFDPTMRYPLVTEVAFIAYQFTTKINKKLAKWLKRKSKRWGGIVSYVREQSVAFARHAGVPGVITGHTHFAEDATVEDVHYVNTGSWTESPFAYVTADDVSGVQLHQVAE